MGGRVFWGIVAILIGLCMSGCFGGDKATVRCADQEQYISSRSAPTVIVPEDLSQPRRSDSLDVPPGDPIEPRPEESTDPCLEAPPDFFETE
jgi:uncharacterized lipoprotein